MIARLLKTATLMCAALAGCSAVSTLPGIGQPDADPRFERLVVGDAPQVEARFQTTGRNAVFVRMSRTAGVSTWIGPFGEAIVLQDGILRGTRGMGEGLVTNEVSASRALILSGQSGQVERFHTYIEGGTGNVVRSFVCDISLRGTENLTISSITRRTTVMDEDCTGPLGSFVNTY